uniref:Uncharacterized protein n=1 Tax=Plectus sambesii TaxID=2011161 RepID=A0A914UR51_9BILA
MEVGRNIGDAVVVSKSAFVNGVCLTMDAVTKTMNFFEFVVDRYFNTEAPVARVRAGRKPTVIPSSRRRLTFSLDHEEEKYEDRDETCKERFGKMQRKISVCIKRQPKSLTTHFVHQACDDFKLLMVCCFFFT